MKHLETKKTQILEEMEEQEKRVSLPKTQQLSVIMKEEAINKSSKWIDNDIRTFKIPQIKNFLDVNKRRLSLFNSKGNNSDIIKAFGKKKSCCVFEEPRLSGRNRLFVSDSTSEVIINDNIDSNKWKKKKFHERFPSRFNSIDDKEEDEKVHEKPY